MTYGNNGVTSIKVQVFGDVFPVDVDSVPFDGGNIVEGVYIK